LFELLVPNEKLRAALVSNGSVEIIKQVAVKGGMRTMVLDGYEKIISGDISVQEVMRVAKAKEG
jgi:type II secretory ATPase GspE/PulE/Tfp pilus assembly ATPase PilB-like protein